MFGRSKVIPFFFAKTRLPFRSEAEQKKNKKKTEYRKESPTVDFASDGLLLFFWNFIFFGGYGGFRTVG